MNRRAAALAIAGICVAALLALVWWRLTGRAAPRPAASAPAPPAAAQRAAATPQAPPAPWNVRLYFPGADGLLHPESRVLEAPAEPQARARVLLAAVLAGPQDGALTPPLPHGVEIDAAFLDPDGVVYLGLRSADHATPPAAGSQAEMASVYSLVDSIALNLEGARRVVLLWNGSQLESFGGHLDTSRPLAPDTSLLAGEPHPEAPAPASAPPNTP